MSRLVGRKFFGLVLGCIVITVVALAGKMDGNVAMCVSVVIGGFYGADSMITRKALALGQHQSTP